MKVRFLLGPAGSCKTHRCLAGIREALLADPAGRPLLLLAPKQATFQLERQLLSDGTLPGYTRLSGLSFERLAAFVFDGLGLAMPGLLAEEGRVMVLRALVQRHRDELRWFRASARFPGFAQQLSLLLREFEHYGAGPDLLAAAAGRVGAESRLGLKLGDLARLQRLYSEWLASHGLEDGDGLLEMAARALRNVAEVPGVAPMFGGVCLDGFAQMTPRERGLLLALLPLAGEATMAFCLEGEPEGESPWYGHWSLVGQLPAGFYEYKYRVTFKNGAQRTVSDLCARYGGSTHQNDGFVIGGRAGELQIAPLAGGRQPLRDLVVYELMIDDFTDEYREARAPLDAVRDRLDYLQHELGVNAILFMPWTAWPGQRFNWGYTPYLYFSVEYRYANALHAPVERLSWLKRLVSECHTRGLHVIMDGVFNHVGDENPVSGEAEGFPYRWLYQNPEACPNVGTFGGSFPGLLDLDYHNGCTQEFIRDACFYWIDNFNIDGIRFDNTVNFYIEDSTLKDIGQSPDVDDTGRVVIRYYLLDGSSGLTHGFTSAWGGRHIEYYNNTFQVTTPNRDPTAAPNSSPPSRPSPGSARGRGSKARRGGSTPRSCASTRRRSSGSASRWAWTTRSPTPATIRLPAGPPAGRAIPAGCAGRASGRPGRATRRATRRRRRTRSDDRGARRTEPRAERGPMKVELTKSYRFEAAHRLPMVPADHKCARMHGHSFEVEVVVAGELDERMGWLVDYADITWVVEPLVRSELDHRTLNDVPVLENPGGSAQTPLSENHPRGRVQAGHMRRDA